MSTTTLAGSLPERFLALVGHDGLRPVRAELGLVGYTLVGSGAYLPPEVCDGDVDLVLLSSRPEVEPESGLPRLLEAVRGRCEADIVVWYIQAVACLLKVVRGGESLDVLWAADERVGDGGAAAAGDDAFRRIPAREAAAMLESAGSRAADCVHLTCLVEAALASRHPTAFTVPALIALRQWARRRQVYGTRYGYPGGSAWMVMLLVYCRWYDAAVLDRGGEDGGGAAAEDVLWHLLLTLALWPWPLPFTTANMRALSTRRHQQPGEPLGGGRVLEGSVGRRLVTSFVVPLPCEGSAWNMTQAVQWPNHLALLRDAWDAGLRRVRVGGPPVAGGADLLEETRRLALVDPWPLFLVVRVPRDARAPAGWWTLVVNRVVPTVWPQLDACGFYARPLCTDEPFVFLLWPQEYVWSRHSRTDLVLPLRERVGNALFHMVLEAHRTLPAGSAPSLADLLPVLSLARRLPDGDNHTGGV